MVIMLYRHCMRRASRKPGTTVTAATPPVITTKAARVSKPASANALRELRLFCTFFSARLEVVNAGAMRLWVFYITKMCIGAAAGHGANSAVLRGDDLSGVSASTHELYHGSLEAHMRVNTYFYQLVQHHIAAIH